LFPNLSVLLWDWEQRISLICCPLIFWHPQTLVGLIIPFIGKPRWVRGC
jgi:hypothetical protein